MRFLLTGASGFIGSEITARLIASGHEVIGVSRNRTVQQCQMYVGSITDEMFIKDLIRKVKNVDLVIHLAATKEGSEHSKIFETNVYGTDLILRTAIELGSKQFIMISGVSVCNNGGPEVISEESLPCPKGAYLLTKYLSEQVLFQNDKFRGQKKVVRIPSPVGPALSKEKIFKNFVESALLDLDLEVWGNGKRLQNYLDLRDFNDAIELLIQYTGEGIWNIAGPEAISDEDLANKVIKLTNSSSQIKILNKIGVPETSMSKISTLKVQNDLGMKFERSIEDTIFWVSKGVSA